MPEADEQLRWREYAAESITVHLTDADVAVLDHIAVELYREHPHDPRREVFAEVSPSRPAAIRWLLEEWRKKHGRRVRRYAPRAAMAEFWKLETCWRRAKRPDTLAQPPEPPWR